MDNGVRLTPEEIQGRNMWLVWTGGNDRFWDRMTKDSLGSLDLLKIVTSHPSQTYCGDERCDRDLRWRWLGAVNEPCFKKPIGPDPRRFGLWLDGRGPNCPPDPFENETEYPGVKIGARGMTFKDGSTLPVGSYFGHATGILGLRLFPNPDFDQVAKEKWDPERYYTDPNYYNDPYLVRPYRIGMACGFCHVGPSPIHPPADPAHPQWSDLNSTGRRPISQDGPRVRLVCGFEELPVSARAFLSAGHDGHVPPRDRLHQQSAHHERDLSARAAARRGSIVGHGDVDGWRTEQ